MSSATASVRPRGCATICSIRPSVTRVTLPSSRVRSSLRLPSSGRDGSASAARRSGLAETTRPNRNSPSSRSSRPSSASAPRTVASTASSSRASVRSPPPAHSASARWVIFPCSSAATTAPFSAAGLPGSDSARRSPCSVSSSPTTANSSPASLVATVALSMCSADSRSDSSAYEALLTPRMLNSPSDGTKTFQPNERDDSSPRWSHASRAGHLLEFFEEPVDHPALPGGVFERLADDPAGQFGGHRADLGAQRGQRLLAFGLDLGLGGLRDPAGLGLGLLAHLGDDLRALLPGLLAQPGRVVPGLGQLLLVLLEDRRGLGLLLCRLFQAALDLLGALGQGLLDPGHEQLTEHAEHQDEGNRPDDQLGQGRDQRVLRRRVGQKMHGRLASGDVTNT